MKQANIDRDNEDKISQLIGEEVISLAKKNKAFKDRYKNHSA